jgi:DnaJ-class molecular chaperone
MIDPRTRNVVINLFKPYQNVLMTCPTCKGLQYNLGLPCHTCGGSGKLIVQVGTEHYLKPPEPINSGDDEND